MANERISFFTRYRGLILSVTIFLLIIMLLLGLNTYATKKIDTLRVQIEATSEMRISMQTITRNLYDLRLSTGEDPLSPHISSVLKDLENNITIFNNLQNALKKGGAVTLADTSIINVIPIQQEDVRKLLDNSSSNWDELSPLIKTYLKTALDIRATETPLDIAINQAQSSSLLIYINIAQIQEYLTKEYSKISRLLTYAQYIGIAVTFGYFILFMFYFIRRLVQSDHKSDEARRETTEILDTVQEGLFLIDKDLKIGYQKSKALDHILPGIEVTQKPLYDVLHSILNENDIENTKDYIDQVFTPRIKENLIRSLNPLNRTQVFFDDGNGLLSERYLKFDFNRVYENKEIKRVLVSVADISESVELEKQLNAEREENTRQIELLIKVLRIEPSTLLFFMRRGQEVTQNINAILQRSNNNQHALRQKIEDIFKEIHGFKGESSALEFDQFVKLSQEMEQKLRALRESSNLTGDDFLSIAVNLDAIIKQLKMLDGLDDRLRHYQQRLTDNVDSIREASANIDNKAISTYFSRFAQRIAERNHKLIHVIVDGFEPPLPFDDHIIDTLKSITVQLVRNAIVHGIELPEKREKLNKSREGNLCIHLRKQERFYDLIIEDDGAGIDTQVLKDKLRQHPDFNRDPDSLSREEILRSIFLTGLSTADGVSEDAGQGVGMDVVRDRIRSIDARIAIASKQNEFTRFVIRIPKQY